MSERLRFERVWAMPSRWTFTIKPIAELLAEEVAGVSVDPFAGKSTIATLRNDLDEGHHGNGDALDWLKTLDTDLADTVLYDPPYSLPQADRRYKKAWNTKTYWAEVRSELARVTKPGGKAICCGWNSGGIGKKHGFEITRVLLVPHGGGRNDTIVTVETKTLGKETNQ